MSSSRSVLPSLADIPMGYPMPTESDFGSSGDDDDIDPGFAVRVPARDPDKVTSINIRLEHAKSNNSKPVTLIEGLTMSHLEPVLKGLKKALGCGGQCDAEMIVIRLQGDQQQGALNFLVKKQVCPAYAINICS